MAKGILIVDDSARTRHCMRRWFESQPGFAVCGEAGDGVEAIERARELRPDLILLDLAMPRMNGLEAAGALQQILPNVPIILFTLHKDAMLKSGIRAAGVGAVVSKTDRMEVLLTAVQRLTGAARAASA